MYALCAVCSVRSWTSGTCLIRLVLTILTEQLCGGELVFVLSAERDWLVLTQIETSARVECCYSPGTSPKPT